MGNNFSSTNSASAKEASQTNNSQTAAHQTKRNDPYRSFVQVHNGHDDFVGVDTASVLRQQKAAEVHNAAALAASQEERTARKKTWTEKTADNGRSTQRTHA